VGVQVTVALIQVSGSFFAFHGNLAGYSDLGSVAQVHRFVPSKAAGEQDRQECAIPLALQ
jgi:hypothetical protein